MPAPSYGYIPAQDAALDLWLQNFATTITATPLAYGLTAGQASTLTTLSTAYTSALATATDPATRTIVTVAAKDTAKASAVAYARSLAMICQEYPGITPALLSAAGLTVRNTVPTPVPPPSTQPILTVLQSAGSQLTIGYADTLSPSAKYKPAGVASLQIVGTFSTVAPAGPDNLPVLKQGGRWPLVVDAGTTNNGKTAFLWGRWMNRKGEFGPWSVLVSAIVQP